jgi:serine/threonine protein kinase/WD40 repeat protein
MNEQAIFSAALTQERERRAAYLHEACGGDAALRQRIEMLLAAHEQAGSFMQQPAAGGLTEAYRPISEGPGAVIGPYKLLQQIGEGGFGVVYMAEQVAPVNRKVALKIIKPGMDTKEVIARFESERQALALMDHPNVARVLDAGATATGRPYFVMELVRGVPITEFCDKNHLPPVGRLELFRAVCLAVQHAHQKGVIHRDLKPTNILVTLHDGNPVPKVIDFGVAKATGQKLTERTLFTAFGQMVGTPGYMSPEQAEMSGLDIDTRTDIYSLGVLLYELLTGTTPLESKRLREAGYAEMQRLIREEEPPRPSIRLSSLGGEATVLAGNRGTDVRRLTQLLRGDLDWIVMKALEKDRNRRYETPGAFAADVERFLHNEPIIARPPAALYKLQKFARRNRATVAMAATVLLLLVLGIAGTTLGLVWAMRAEEDARHDALRAWDAEQLAAQRLIDVQRERDTNQRARAAAETTAAQEDSRRLAAESVAARPNNPGLALLLAVAAARKSPARSASHNNALLAALRACREERTLFAPPFRTAEGRTGRTSFYSARVTPDGTRAVAVGVRFNDPGSDTHFAEDKTDSAYVYDLASGQVTATMRLPGLWFRAMAISPDGKWVVAVPDRTIVVRYTDGQFVAYTEQAVRLWEIATGKEVRVFTGHTDRVVSLAFDTRGERLLTASWDRTARIWDVATGKSLHVLGDSTASLQLAEFSADGRRVLTVPTQDVQHGPSVAGSGGQTGGGRAFPLAQTTIDPPARTAGTVDWISPLLGGSSRGAQGMHPPCLWDAESGKRLAVLDAPSADRGYYGGIIYAAGFSPDSQRVVVTRHDQVRLWNAADGKPIMKHKFVGEAAEGLIEDGDRRLRVVRAASGSPGLFLWQSAQDPQAWQRSPVAVRGSWQFGSDGTGPAVLLDSNCAGPPLIARAMGHAVSVCSLTDNREVAVLRGHDDTVTTAAFFAGGKRILTAARDGTLRLWDLATAHHPIVEIKRTNAPPLGYAVFAGGGKHVLAAQGHTWADVVTAVPISLWDAASGAPIRDIANEAALATSALHKELVGQLHDLDVSPTGDRLVTVHADYYPCTDPKEEPRPHPLYTPVRVWDLRTGNRLFALEGLCHTVAVARFSPDGRRLLTIAEGRHRYAILRDGKRIVAADEGHTRIRIDLWDSQTGKHVRNLVPESHMHSYFALTPWSRDGKRILADIPARAGEPPAAILDAETGDRICALAHGAGPINRGSISPDGKRVLGYRKLNHGNRELVEVWDAVTGALCCTLRGHTGDVTSAEFSPDRRRILTTSTDGTARLWDASGRVNATDRAPPALRALTAPPALRRPALVATCALPASPSPPAPPPHALHVAGQQSACRRSTGPPAPPRGGGSPGWAGSP